MTIYEGFDLFEYSEEVGVCNTWEPNEDPRNTLAGTIVAESFIEEIDIPQ
jgi:hypothetical protein